MSCLLFLSEFINELLDVKDTTQAESESITTPQDNETVVTLTTQVTGYLSKALLKNMDQANFIHTGRIKYTLG